MGSSDRLPDAGGQLGSGAADRRVDFETWQHATLAQFAFDANKRILELEVDRKLLLEAYRELLRRAQ
jgi:hypothetical protein